MLCEQAKMGEYGVLAEYLQKNDRPLTVCRIFQQYPAHRHNTAILIMIFNRVP